MKEFVLSTTENGKHRVDISNGQHFEFDTKKEADEHIDGWKKAEIELAAWQEKNPDGSLSR